MAVESSLLEKIFGVGQYVNKSRKNVFIVRNEWRMGKAGLFFIKQGIMSSVDFGRINSVHYF